jgi:hypothetical protein
MIEITNDKIHDIKLRIENYITTQQEQIIKNHLCRLYNSIELVLRNSDSIDVTGFLFRSQMENIINILILLKDEKKELITKLSFWEIRTSFLLNNENKIFFENKSILDKDKFHRLRMYSGPYANIIDNIKLFINDEYEQKFQKYGSITSCSKHWLQNNKNSIELLFKLYNFNEELKNILRYLYKVSCGYVHNTSCYIALHDINKQIENNIRMYFSILEIFFECQQVKIKILND